MKESAEHYMVIQYREQSQNYIFYCSMSAPTKTAFVNINTLTGTEIRIQMIQLEIIRIGFYYFFKIDLNISAMK